MAANNDYPSVNAALITYGFDDLNHRIYLMGIKGFNNLNLFCAMTAKDIRDMSGRIN